MIESRHGLRYYYTFISIGMPLGRRGISTTNAPSKELMGSKYIHQAYYKHGSRFGSDIENVGR